MKVLLVLSVALLLGACTAGPGSMVRHLVAEQGKASAGQALEDAEWMMCRAAPIGSVMDRYGMEMEAYREICRAHWR